MIDSHLKVVPNTLDVHPPRSFTDPVIAALPADVAILWSQTLFTVDGTCATLRDCRDPDGRWHWNAGKVDPVLGPWRSACLDEALSRLVDWAKAQVRERHRQPAPPNVLDVRFGTNGDVTLRWLHDPRADERQLQRLLDGYPGDEPGAAAERASLRDWWAALPARFADPARFPDLGVEPVDPAQPAGPYAAASPQEQGDPAARWPVTAADLLGQIAHAMSESGPPRWLAWSVDATLDDGAGNAWPSVASRLRYRQAADQRPVESGSRLRERLDDALAELRRVHVAGGMRRWQRVRVTHAAGSGSVSVDVDPEG